MELKKGRTRSFLLGRFTWGFSVALACALSPTTAVAQQTYETEPTQEPAKSDKGEVGESESETSPATGASDADWSEAEKETKKPTVHKKRKRRDRRQVAQADTGLYPVYDYRGSPVDQRGEREPPKKTYEYRQGDEIPEDYHLESSPRWALVATGASLTSSLWLSSLIYAVAADREANVNGDANFDDMYWPMFIPVVGPFMTIATADSSGTGAAILGLDGAMQAAGVAMFIAGYAAPKWEIVPDRKIGVAPSASPSTAGLSITGEL